MDDFSKRVEALSPERRELLEIFLKEKKIETEWLEESYVAPRNEVEAALADLWSQVLGVERVGIHDNFFELGGDSILSIQIIARAGEMGLKITRNQLFEQPTIAEIAPLVERAGPGEPEEEASGPLPLTPAQLALLQTIAGPAGRAALLPVESTDEESLRRAAAAVIAVIKHHDALRLRFEQDASGTGWTQSVDAAADPEIPRVDLSHLEESAQETEAVRRALRLLDGWDVTRAPLLRLELLDRGAGRPAWLAVAAHPLVCDAESFRLLLQDLETALRGGALLPRSTSFASWCRRLARHAAAPELEREISWWQAQGEGSTTDLPMGPGGAEPAAPVAVLLDADETRAVLQEIPATHRIQVTELLITALAQTLAEHTGAPSARLDLEGSARIEPVLGADLSRTVGACGFIWPVRLDLAGAGTPAAALRTVKEQLRRVPERGIGYALLAGQGKLPTLPPAAVLVTSRPRLDEGGARFVGEAEGGGRTYPLTVVAGASGHRVEITWEPGAGFQDRATLERLAATFAAALRALIAGCRSGGLTLTPSDFPDADLDQGDLAKLFGR